MGPSGLSGFNGIEFVSDHRHCFLVVEPEPTRARRGGDVHSGIEDVENSGKGNP